MFYDNITDVRQQFIRCWSNYQQRKPLSPLESQLIDVILAHPEFHATLEANNVLERQFFPELGETNPFLHMGLHLSVREQVHTNRPAGIHAIYQQLCQRHSPLDAEHALMNCLAESLWLAQKNQTLPDEQAYLTACRAL
jgi:hypothetical protein